MSIFFIFRYAVEFFRTPKFIHFLGEHHRVLKKKTEQISCSVLTLIHLLGIIN